MNATQLKTALPLRAASSASRRGARRAFHGSRARGCASCEGTRPGIREALNATAKDPPTPAADHRTLGSALDLFSTTAYSPGTPLLHADGSHVFLKLQQFLRAQYGVFGFREVVSPTIYKQSLWERSGHWENYKDDMFEVTGGAAARAGNEAGEGQTYGLKPMNCPGHCLLFKSRGRSWRDLPVRYADFSPLHRNEISGALSGLTRMRRFHQDDGHIFCTAEQVGEEIHRTLQFVGLVYNVFGLGPYKLVLSTRPTDFIGEISQWDRAESQLRDALDATGRGWDLNEGDGAFYGPKIDIILKDSDGKEHQTATIQLDFQLPQRFELSYDSPEGIAEHPVLIHRAVLGSLERFMALLIEHYKGRFPFWLSPRQLAILPVNDEPSTLEYVAQVQDVLNGFSAAASPRLQPLNSESFRATVDARSVPISAKIAQAKADHFNLLAVLGKREVQAQNLSLDATGQPGAAGALKSILGVEDSPKATKLTPSHLRTLMGHLQDQYI